MSDLVLTPEEMVAELQYRSEIIKELVETNGGLRDENGKLREALKVLAEHCNNMEAQNQDYHTMGEGGSPCLSEPLANAYAIMRESGDAFEDCRGIAPDATGEMSSEEFIRKERDEW